MKKNLSILLGILLIISISINTYYFLKSNTTVSEQNRKYFDKYKDSIINDFQYNDYKEVTKSYSHLLSLPVNKPDEYFINRQKLFIYNDDTSNIIITVSLTVSEYNKVNNNEWVHSYNISPKIVNKFSKQNDILISQVANVAVASQSFNLNGCNVTVMAISDSSGVENKVAQELINFNNNLISFLNQLK